MFDKGFVVREVVDTKKVWHTDENGFVQTDDNFELKPNKWLYEDFEKDELRAPAANFYAEQLVWLTRINNLRVYDENSQERPLTKEEHDLILNMPLEMKSDIKYSSFTLCAVQRFPPI